jgi:hypothetical protein
MSNFGHFRLELVESQDRSELGKMSLLHFLAIIVYIGAWVILCNDC